MSSSIKNSCVALLLGTISLYAGCSGHADRPADVATNNVAGPAPAGGSAESAADTREFHFTYAATINQLPAGANARVWIPLAASNSDQAVKIEQIEVPGDYQQATERKFCNRILYFEATANGAGEIPVKIEYHVRRRALLTNNIDSLASSNSDCTPSSTFLSASAMVPVDGSIIERFFGPRAELPKGGKRAVAKSFYDRVYEHMTYDKSGAGWGRGDVKWACESGVGNCSDFHSVFISLCRDLEIPAKFEIGFPVPADPAGGEISGYHCWAKFLDGKTWVPVDISEADKHPEQKEYLFGNLPHDRVMFSTGRDLELVPPQATGPVNFFIYPHVEVDGKLHTEFTKNFQYSES